ncbi:hypothetical protein IFT66_23030 [Rhizobium sp. CFBP 13726]|nr:hypothetical protein [Rhizobium sp. CFBP 13726]
MLSLVCDQHGCFVCSKLLKTLLELHWYTE